MAKKGLGKLIALAAVAGAAAAGISYLLKYREFHQELEKDFRDFEDDSLADEDFEFEDMPDENPPERNYVSLNPEPDSPVEEAYAGEEARGEEAYVMEQAPEEEGRGMEDASGYAQAGDAQSDEEPEEPADDTDMDTDEGSGQADATDDDTTTIIEEDFEP